MSLSVISGFRMNNRCLPSSICGNTIFWLVAVSVSKWNVTMPISPGLLPAMPRGAMARANSATIPAMRKFMRGIKHIPPTPKAKSSAFAR